MIKAFVHFFLLASSVLSFPFQSHAQPSPQMIYSRLIQCLEGPFSQPYMSDKTAPMYERGQSLYMKGKSFLKDNDGAIIFPKINGENIELTKISSSMGKVNLLKMVIPLREFRNSANQLESRYINIDPLPQLEVSVVPFSPPKGQSTYQLVIQPMNVLSMRPASKLKQNAEANATVDEVFPALFNDLEAHIKNVGQKIEADNDILTRFKTNCKPLMDQISQIELSSPLYSASQKLIKTYNDQVSLPLKTRLEMMKPSVTPSRDQFPSSEEGPDPADGAR